MIILLAAAFILSFSACARRTKTNAGETALSEAESDDAEITDTLTDITDTMTSAETATETTANTTTATVQTNKQTTATTKAQKAKDNSGIFDNLNNAPKLTTTKVTTGTTAAPASQQSAYDIYKAAFDKTNSLTSFDADFVSNSNASVSGTFLYDDSISGNYKMVRNGGSLKALIQENEKFKGSTTGSQISNLSFYFANGKEYVSADDKFYKFESDQTRIENDAVVLHNSKALSEQDFEYAKFSTSNGYTTITLNPSSRSTETLVGSSWDSLYKYGSNTFTDATENIEINPQGYIDSIQLKCNEIEPLKNPNNNSLLALTMTNTMTVTYKNPGQPVTMTLPPDLSSFFGS